jgi:hypothetical protein
LGDRERREAMRYSKPAMVMGMVAATTLNIATPAMARDLPPKLRIRGRDDEGANPKLCCARNCRLTGLHPAKLAPLSLS